MKLTLKSCTLRNLKVEDAESLAFHANNPEIAKFLRAGFPSPYRLEDAITFINNTKQTKHLNLGIEVDQEICGVIGLIYHHTKIKEAELGFWLGETQWGKGIITEAVRGIVDYGFNKLDLNRIYSSCFIDNYGSIRVHEKIGFKFNGIEKDVCTNAHRTESRHYEMLRSDYLI